MGKRLSKIYTRTGDDGSTATADGQRISKSDLLFEVMGDVDELNSHIGLIRAQLQQSTLNIHLDKADSNTSLLDEPNLNASQPTKASLSKDLCIIQHLLFNLGGQLALPVYQGITSTHTDWLEQQIDAMNAYLPALADFILPTGSVLVSQLHIARSVCRRVERHAVKLSIEQPHTMNAVALTFINRLSDWLFVSARYCTDSKQSQEVLWDKLILQDFD